MPIDSDLFKQGLSRWASGVTVVTTRTDDGPSGLTASAFSSVSAEPPLVLVCVNMSSGSCDPIREAGFFAVNILKSDQIDISNRFASSKDKHLRFAGETWTDGPIGAPMLSGSLASLECRVVSEMEQGTHRIYIGEVTHLVPGEGQPLLYYRGGYRAIADL